MLIRLYMSSLFILQNVTLATEGNTLVIGNLEIISTLASSGSSINIRQVYAIWESSERLWFVGSPCRNYNIYSNIFMTVKILLITFILFSIMVSAPSWSIWKHPSDFSHNSHYCNVLNSCSTVAHTFFEVNNTTLLTCHKWTSFSKSFYLELNRLIGNVFQIYHDASYVIGKQT